MLSPAVFLVCVGFYIFSSFVSISGASPIRWDLPDWSTSGCDKPECGQKVDGWSKQGQRLGAVASESSMCSGFGIDMLKLGGNAADAMVATTFCIGTVAMYHSGIGGGGFMLVRAPNNSFEFIDFRETAPAAAFQDMFKNNTDASTLGGLASGVPGEVRGLEYLHKKYGLLPWRLVMQPAIKIARYGFPVTEDLAYYMDSATKGKGKTDFLTKNPTWALDFAPNGTRLGVGDIITRRRYADTLETISKRGADAFYSGPIAETMINALKRANGTMTLEDLKNYTVAIRDTASVQYRGFKVTSTTAPSSGSILLSTLNILEGYKDFYASGNVNLSTHRMDEAMRFAYGQRTNFGDPLFVKGLGDYEKRILNETVSNKIREKISDFQTQNVSYYNPSGFESLETPGTSHISTGDRSGLSIGLTTTVNLYFGNKLMVPETGIIMNNEMDDFSTPGSSNSFGYLPSPSNYIRPGKRPLSSICPTIVTFPNGTVYFITGAAGGSQIITSTLQSAINVIDRGMTAREALAAPRLHDQLVPDLIEMENSYDKGVVAFLKSRKHNITFVDRAGSTVQSIRVLTNGTFEASGEPRQKDSGGLAI